MIGIRASKFSAEFDQRTHRGIDVSAIVGNFAGIGPGDKPALRARLPRPRRDVIGIEQIGKALIERFVIRRKRTQQKLLEKPGRVRPMPFGRAGVRHRLDDLILGRQQRRAPLGLAAHRLKGIQPTMARIVRRLRSRNGIVRRISYPNTLGSGST